MNKAPLTLMIVAALCTAAQADVVVNSRSSTLRDYGGSSDGSGDQWDDVVSTTAFGAATITTPRNVSFTSNVTPGLMSGSMNGYSGSSPAGGGGTLMAIEVVFTITDAPASITILLDGGNYPTGNSGLRLYNSSDFPIFDAMSIFTYANPFQQGNGGEWTDDTWTSVLPVGTYRLTAFANGLSTVSGTGGSGGGGNLDFTVTIVPAPSAAACLLPLAGFALRRRRA